MRGLPHVFFLTLLGDGAPHLSTAFPGRQKGELSSHQAKRVLIAGDNPNRRASESGLHVDLMGPKSSLENKQLSYYLKNKLSNSYIRASQVVQW